MLRIKASQQTLLILIGVCIIIFAGSAFTYANRTKRFVDLQNKVSEKESLLMDSQRTVRKLVTTKEEYLDDQSKLGVLEMGVSTKAYVPTLLRQLEDLGRGVNLKVVGVRPKAVEAQVEAAAAESGNQDNTQKIEKKPDPYDKLTVDIEVNGKYWDVVRFLHEITTFPKIIAVNDLQITPMSDSEGKGSPNLSVKLNTTAFILRDNAATKNESKNAPESVRT